MNASNLNERNGPPLSVTIVTRQISPVAVSVPVQQQAAGVELLGLGDREGDRGDGVVLVRGR